MNPSESPHIMLLAGEASGDAHAAEVAIELKKMQPGIRLSGMGSDEMQQVGVDLFFDSRDIAVVGIVEILKHWGDIKKALDLVKHKLETTRPDLLILVDYPEFNLKMARHAKSLGIKVLFYISPQVWAWRPKRIHKIGRSIDHMAVLFEFEVDYYRRADIPVTFVGHPLVDKVKTSEHVGTTRQRLGIEHDARVVGLFPGSRHSEINKHLELLLDTAVLMQQQNAALQFVLPVASSLNYDEIKLTCDRYDIKLTLTQGELYDVIANCDAIASCSGTVTLEIALLQIPMCIFYKTSELSYQILKRLVTIDHLGLANIITQKEIVRELIQHDASPQKISAELFELLNNENYRAKVIEDLKLVKQSLGMGQGSKRMAELALSLLGVCRV